MTTLLETSGRKSKLSSSDTMPRLVVNSKRTRVLAALICESSSGYLQPSLKFREASVNGLMLKSNFLSLAHFWAASVVRRRTRSGEASGGRCISLHRVPIAEIHGQSNILCRLCASKCMSRYLLSNALQGMMPQRHPWSRCAAHAWLIWSWAWKKLPKTFCIMLLWPKRDLYTNVTEICINLLKLVPVQNTAS